MGENKSPPRVKNIRIWLTFYLAFIFFAVFISYYLNELPPKYTELNSGIFINSVAATPDQLEKANGIAVTLPDMHTAESINSTEGWYVIPIEAKGSLLLEDKICVYIPVLSHNIEVYVNNTWLGNGGSMQPPVARLANHPLIFNLDRKNINNKSNKLYIHVKGMIPRWTYLGKVYIGSEASLVPFYKKQKLLRVNLIIATSIALIFTSLFALFLWFIRREDTYYLWYSVAELLWLAHDSNLFLKQAPFRDEIWEAIVLLTIGWSIICFIFFIRRYIGVYNKKIDRSLFLIYTVFSLPLLYPNLNWIIFYGYKIWLLLVLLIGIYGISLIIQYYRKTKDQNALLMILAGGVMIIFGVHDLLAVNGILPPSSPYIMYISSVLIILIISSLLIRRFIESLHVVENFNKELQQEVEKKESQLRIEYKKTQKLQEKQVVNEERERIMRDIHDGIGGQLITTLAATESSNSTMSNVKNSLKIAIQDLRLVIDSLDGDSQELSTILGTLRMRLSGLLKDANIDLIWQVGDLPMLEEFGPEKALNTMRIIQEAITNVVKHSESSSLTISTYTKIIDKECYAIVEVKDEGNGNLNNITRGRGLSNMERRSARMQALFNIYAVEGKGCRVTLAFDTKQ